MHPHLGDAGFTRSNFGAAGNGGVTSFRRVAEIRS